MDKRRRKGNLLFIVCYLCLTSGKGNNDTSTSTSSQMTTSVDEGTSEFTTTTTASNTTNDTTTQTATITTDQTGDTTATTAITGVNTERTTMSSSVISTPNSNTDTPSTVTTATTNATMTSSAIFPSGTSTTSTSGTVSIPQWILTIVIPVICGLLLLMIMTVIVCHRCHRKHGDQPMITKQEMNGRMDRSDVELVRFENECVDKNDLHQPREDENKVLNKECSKRGDYDEVSLDGPPRSECESASKNDRISNGINRNLDEYKISAKSKDALKEDADYSDIEVNEGSAKEITRLQISRSSDNDNHHSEVTVHSGKDSSEQTENPVYMQPIKHVYSSLSANWNLKRNAENSDKSEKNQATDENNHTDSSYYDYADVNVSKNTNMDNETFDATYDHLDLDRVPQRNFTNRPVLYENMLLEDEYENHIISCREDKNTVGAKDLYSTVSSRPKHDQQVDTDISGGAHERDDSNRKMAEQEKVLVEADTNVYDNIDKSTDSLKSQDSERTAETENKTTELQMLTGFTISPQKQATDARSKCKEPNPEPAKSNFDNINNENKQNEGSTSPNGSRKNYGIQPKGGEILKAGLKFKPKGGEILKAGPKLRIKETNYKEANPTDYQEPTKPQKSIRSDYEEVETVLG